MRYLILLSACALGACMSTPEPRAPAPAGQSFKEAISVMCDVDKLAGVDADADPLGAGVKRTAYVNAHVDNPDGIELRTLLSVKGAADQARMLRERAKEAGEARCALADTLEKSGTGGLSP